MAGQPYSKVDQCGPPRPKPATKARRKHKGGQVPRALVARRSGGLCELGLEGICRVKADCFHHRLMRAHDGPDTVENLMHLCNAGCHAYVHANPEESYLRGWLIRSTSPVPVRHEGAQ